MITLNLKDFKKRRKILSQHFSQSSYFHNKNKSDSETYSELCQISKLELLTKIVNGLLYSRKAYA